MAVLHTTSHNLRKERIMTDTNVPLFSSFRRLRQTNPDLYYTADTHRKMLNAQKRLGIKFYDLLDDTEQAYELV